MSALSTTAPAIKIPNLPSWAKEGSTRTLFRPQLGYLHIKTDPNGGFALTQRADTDGVEVAQPVYIGTEATAAACVELARTYVAHTY